MRGFKRNILNGNKTVIKGKNAVSLALSEKVSEMRAVTPYSIEIQGLLGITYALVQTDVKYN